MVPSVSFDRSPLRVREIFTRGLNVLIAQTLYGIAVLWRRALRATTFVAVTGTHGKTTTLRSNRRSGGRCTRVYDPQIRLLRVGCQHTIWRVKHPALS